MSETNSLVKILKAREAMLPAEIEVRVSQIASAFAFIGHLSEHFGQSFVNTAARFWSGDLRSLGPNEPASNEDDPHKIWRAPSPNQM